MLLISVLLYSITALSICLVLFQKITLTKAVITFFIASFSLNILIGEVLSLAGLLNKPWAYLGLQCFFCITIIVWLLFRQRGVLRDGLRQLHYERNPFHGVDYLLLTIISLVMGTLLYVGLRTPPNNLDSLHTHLLRIYYWLQHGSLANWNATGVYQLIYPINAHLQGLWLFLLGKSESLFFLVSWFSLAVIACVVFEIARILKFSTTQALFSVMLLLTCAVVLLQVYSFQNDLTVAAMVMVAGWALLNYAREQRLPDLLVVMLALALSLGIKQTAFFVLPFFFLAALVLLLKKQVNTYHLKWLPLVAGFFLFFSFYQYAQNLASFHSFFGVNDVITDQYQKSGTLLGKVGINTARFLVDFVNFDGIGKIPEDHLLTFKDSFFSSLFSSSRFDLQSERYLATGYDLGEEFSYAKNRDLSEDTSWFGPLFFLLTPVSLAVVFLQKDTQRKRYAALALLYFALYLILIVIQRPGWDPYQGRYFILGVVPFFPLLGACLPEKRAYQKIVLTLLIVASAYIAFNVVCLNNSKPLITTSTISTWQNKYLADVEGQSGIETFVKKGFRFLSYQLYQNAIDRWSILESSYYEQLYYSETRTLPDVLMVNDVLLQGEPLYLIMSRDPLEYGSFGINRSRNLYPLDNSDEVPLNAVVLVQKGRDVSTDRLQLVTSGDRYSVYRRVK